MLTLIILVVLLIGVYAGARRGLVLQVVYTIGYILSFFVAKAYYLNLSEKLEMLVPYSQPGIDDNMIYYNTAEKLNLDYAFYNALAFLLIIAIGWLITRTIGYMLNSLTFLPLLREVNYLGGGLLGFIMQYLAIFLFLKFLTFIPFEFVQDQFTNSGLANWIVQNTPYLSTAVYDWWLGIVNTSQ